MKSTLVLSLAQAAICSSLVFAEVPSPQGTDPTFRMVLRNLVESDAFYKQAMSQLDRESSVQIESSRSWEPELDFQLQSVRVHSSRQGPLSDPQLQNEANLFLKWNLYSYGYDQKRIDYSKSQALRILEQRELERLKAEERSANMVLSYLESCQLLEVSKVQQKAKAHLLSVQSQRKDLGYVSQVDFNTLQVSTALADMNLEDAEQLLEAKLWELNQRVPSTTCSMQWPLDRSELIFSPEKLERWASERLKKEAPNVRVSRLKVVEKEWDLEAAKRAFGPRLDFQFSYGQGLDQNSVSRIDLGSLGLVLTVPLLDRGQKKVLTSVARSEVYESKFLLEEDQQRQSFDRALLVKQVKASLRKFQMTKDLTKIAEKNYHLNQQRYERQLTSLIELNQSELNYYSSLESSIKLMKSLHEQIFRICFRTASDLQSCFSFE